MSFACWQLDKFVGKFRTAAMVGSCDLLQPASGVSAELFSEQSRLRDIFLLGPTLPPVQAEQAAEQVECFARGGDLAAIYAATQSHPYRTQVYWRLGSHPCQSTAGNALAAIELVLSKQTDLLDALPQTWVRSDLPTADEVLRLIDPRTGRFDSLHDLSSNPVCDLQTGTGCFVLRLASTNFSYVEIVHPADFQSSQLQASNGRIATAHELFRHRLEKGVILRSRVLGLVVPRNDDLAIVRTHFESFAASEPPLAT